ncbi:hypothetical protein AB1P65_02480 [Roseibium alexandrii]
MTKKLDSKKVKAAKSLDNSLTKVVVPRLEELGFRLHPLKEVREDSGWDASSNMYFHYFVKNISENRICLLTATVDAIKTSIYVDVNFVQVSEIPISDEIFEVYRITTGNSAKFMRTSRRFTSLKWGFIPSIYKLKSISNEVGKIDKAAIEIANKLINDIEGNLRFFDWPESGYVELCNKDCGIEILYR